MAMELTLAAISGKLILCFPGNPSASVSPKHPFSSSFRPQTQKLRSLKYSLQDQEHGYNHTVYPKPIEIPWKKEICNTVQLVGNVGVPIEIKQLPSGKVVAWTRLAFRKSATETSWINLTFWDELAHVAAEHVQKGHRIAVSGRLISDTVETDDNAKPQTYYKVVVQQLNFVESSMSPTSLYDHDYNDNMTAGKKLGNSGDKRSTEELWQAFFANPAEWWDNRNNKKSPNYPDFKHKDSGEALWIDGKYNPAWVKSQLAILDANIESLQDQDSQTHNFSQY